MKRLIITMLISLPLFATDDKKETKVAEPPKLTSEVKSAFWRVAFEQERQQTILDQVRKKYADTLQVMQKVCGENYTLGTDQKGDPSCVEKQGPIVTPSKEVKEGVKK